MYSLFGLASITYLLCIYYYYILQFFIHTDFRYIIIGRRQNLNLDFDFRVPSTYPNFSKNAVWVWVALLIQ